MGIHFLPPPDSSLKNKSDRKSGLKSGKKSGLKGQELDEDQFVMAFVNHQGR